MPETEPRPDHGRAGSLEPRVAVLPPAEGATLPASPAAVPQIRRAIRRFAQRHGAHPRVLHRMELAVSEAATNAVVHAYEPGEGGEVSYAIDAEADEFEIVVMDLGHGLREKPSEGLGLGLKLIAMLADDFAISAQLHGGLEVWMRFSR